MKKIIKQEPNFKYVESGTKPVDVFIAEDGKEFKGYGAELECEKYEKELLRKKFWESIEKIDESFPDIWCWYHPKTEEELLFVLCYMGMDDGYNYVTVDNVKIQHESLKNYFKPGDWIGYNYEGGGNYRDNHYVYTLKYIKNSIKFLDKLT